MNKKSDKLGSSNYKKVENVEQLLSFVEEKIIDKDDKKIAGLYIRTANNDKTAREQINKQEKELERYCYEHDINNRIIYYDIGSSGLSFDRKGFKRLVRDIKKGIISEVIVTDISKIHRSFEQLLIFFNKKEIKNIKFISLDSSIENLSDRIYGYKKMIYEAIKNFKSEKEEEEEEEEEF